MIGNSTNRPSAVETNRSTGPDAVRQDVQTTAARHGALGLIGAIAAGGGGLALTVVVGRVLDAHNAGIYFTAVAMFTIATGILIMGTDTGLVRELSALRAAGRTNMLRPTVVMALRPVLFLSLVVAAVTLVSAPTLTNLAFSSTTAPEMAQALRLLAPFLIASTLSMALLNGAARGLGSLRTFTTVQQVFLPVGRVALVLTIGLAASAGLLGAVPAGYAALAAWAVPLIVALAMALRAVRNLLPPTTAHDPVDARRFWRATAPRAVAATFEVIIVWADVVLVTMMLGAARGGIYAAASRFVTSGTFALQAVRLSIAPLLAAAFARRDRTEAAGVHRLSVQWAILSTWPVYLAMAIFAPGVLSLLGPEYGAAATALSILCLAMLGVVATGNANTVLNMAHRSHWAAMNTGAAVLIMLGLDLVLIPRFGIVGAAIGWSAAMLVDALCGVTEVRFGLGLKSFDHTTLRAIVTVLAAFGAPAVAVRLLDANRLAPAHPLALLVIGGSVATATYVLALRVQRHALGLDVLISSLRRRKGGGQIPVQAGPPDTDGSSIGASPKHPSDQ